MDVERCLLPDGPNRSLAWWGYWWPALAQGGCVWKCGSLRPEMGQGNAEMLLRWKWCLRVAIGDTGETGHVLTTEVVTWCLLYRLGVHWKARWRTPPECAFCQWKLQAEQNPLYKMHVSDSLWSQRGEGCGEQQSCLGGLLALQVLHFASQPAWLQRALWKPLWKTSLLYPVQMEWGKCSHQSTLKFTEMSWNGGWEMVAGDRWDESCWRPSAEAWMDCQAGLGISQELANKDLNLISIPWWPAFV